MNFALLLFFSDMFVLCFRKKHFNLTCFGYNEKRCIDYLPAKEHFDNWNCQYISELGLSNKDSYFSLDALVANVKI